MDNLPAVVSRFVLDNRMSEISHMGYIDEILMAVNRSNRSGREISKAAVGHDSAVRNLKRGQDLRVSTLEALCRELELEFYVGEPRLGPPGISKVLELNYSSSPEEAAAALGLIERLRDSVTRILQAAEREKRQAASEISAKQIRNELELYAHDRDYWKKRDSDYIDVPYATKVEPSPKGVAFEMWSGDKPRIQRHSVPNWASHEDLVLIAAPDDSMRPTLEQGDPVLLDRSKTVPLEGKLFLALYPFELAIRRVVRAGSGLILCSDTDNLKHPPRGYEPGVTLLYAEVAWHGGGMSRSILYPLSGWPVDRSDSDEP